MEIECVKDRLNAAVRKTERITGKNLTLPVLSSILIIADKTSIKLRATNLDLGIEIEVPARVKKNGVVAVPGALLANLLSGLYNTDNVHLSVLRDNLVVSTDNNKTLLKCFPWEDFPTIPIVSEGENITIPAEKLVDGLRSVWYAAGMSDMKPEISSVCIHHGETGVFFVATDSFRLAKKNIQLKKNKEFPPILIPIKNITEILRVFEGVSEDVFVTFNKNQISFHYDQVYLTSRLIDGIFPDYQQIIPKQFTTEAVVLKQDLLNTLKLTNVFSNKLNQTHIKISPQNKTLTIETKNADIGENTTIVDGAVTGEGVEALFNHRYLQDCFQSIHKDSVSLRFSGQQKPMIISGVGDQGFIYLVMPMSG